MVPPILSRLRPDTHGDTPYRGYSRRPHPTQRQGAIIHYPPLYPTTPVLHTHSVGPLLFRAMAASKESMAAARNGAKLVLNADPWVRALAADSTMPSMHEISIASLVQTGEVPSGPRRPAATRSSLCSPSSLGRKTIRPGKELRMDCVRDRDLH